MITYLSIFILSMLHPIHISKCQMEVNETSKRMEITMHVFIDDLQEIIELQGAPSLKLGTEKEYALADSFIATYIQQHLIIENDGKTVPYVWLGKQLSDDYQGFWLFLESEPIDESSDIAVEYSVLQDLFDDQKNLLNVMLSNRDEQYFLLEKEKARVSLE